MQNKESVVGVNTGTTSNVDGNTNTPTIPTTPTGTVTQQPANTKPASTLSATLKIGQTATLNDVSITPVKVSYDSRCPKDVKCVQAGSLDLSVLLEKLNLSQTLILTSGKSVVFGNRTITISAVSPVRVSTKVIPEADYRFTVTVSK